jgi:hypothetical protein
VGEGKGGREGRRKERGTWKIKKDMWEEGSNGRKKAIRVHENKNRTAPASCKRKTVDPSSIDKGLQVSIAVEQISFSWRYRPILCRKERKLLNV